MRKLGKALVLSAMAVFALGLFACGSQPASGSSTEYADQQFIADLGKALEARWDITESMHSDSNTDEDREFKEKAVSAELSRLEDYSSAQFEDTSLQERAIKYINCLKDQKSSLDYYSADHSKFADEWEKAYNARTQLLKDFSDNYGLTISSKYESTFKDLITNATLVNEEEGRQAAVDAICASMQFDPVESEYGHEYAAVVENTADFDFSYFSINVNLLDADGVVVESTGDSVNNWEKGQKVKFSFHTSEDFSSLTVKSSSWDAEE